MSFSETIFLFVLALIVFGPKKLPEMARQAGKLLAELRRASNEFRSQIETEIAHIEVQKDAQNKDASYKQAVLPPTEPPQGTVASLSLNPAVSESIPHPPPESTATLAAPPVEAPAADSTAAAAISRSAPSDTDADESVSASQESHA
jgi:sec-independent protein translocase protein TatB